MPPNRRINRECIIECATKILEKESMDSINARRIAHELKCSVQPIFYNFKSMEELKAEVFARIYGIYQEYMKAGASKGGYKGTGLAYISFARDYPTFFKTIFMGKTELSPEGFIDNDSMGNDIIEIGRKLTGYSYEKQKKFQLKVWIFTHGLAVLVAMNTVKFNENEIDELLQKTVAEIKKGIDSE